MEMENPARNATRILNATGADQAHWHEHASAIARAQFGRSVFVRGVVEVSNFCRENCHYCGMRRDNRSLARQRAALEPLINLIVQHRPPCITDLNIQSGEDPVVIREVVLPLIQSLRQLTPLGISVCLGTHTPQLYADLLAAGASLYILKFESADPALYEQLEAPGTLAERIRNIEVLAQMGWKVSSGFIAGLPGQSLHAAETNLNLASRLPLHGCSVSPFIPGESTPLSHASPASLDPTLNCMAALRIQHPTWIIPAVSALNLAGTDDGYVRGLRAGANLCTINLTPPDLRGDYLLYRRDRFIMNEDRVLAAIESAGLSPASHGLSAHWQPPAPAPAPAPLHP